MYPTEPEQLTLFPPGTREHANLFLTPGSAEAKKMTVTSGLKLLGSSEKSDPVGLLVKMLLGTSHWGSTMCLMTWGGLSYACQTFVIPAAAIGSPQRRDRVFIVGYTEHDGHVASEIRRGIDKTGDNDKEGQNEAGEPSGASRPGDNEAMAHANSFRNDSPGKYRVDGNGQEISEQREQPQRGPCDDGEIMANSSSEGLSQRRQPGFAESYPETGTGMESESERCSEDVADPKCFGQSGSRESIKPINPTQNQDGETSGAHNDSIGAKRSIEPGLGGVLNGIPDRLDEHRWPAGLGQPQHDWEPPRVASGVKNRVGRLKGLGNAVSPQQIYSVLYFIKQINDSLELKI